MRVYSQVSKTLAPLEPLSTNVFFQVKRLRVSFSVSGSVCLVVQCTFNACGIVVISARFQNARLSVTMQ